MFASQPPASAPVAVANEPARLYQAKTCVRRWSGMSWVRAACSMDRNGPISLPLGLMTPMMAAAVSSSGLRVSRKTTPASTISSGAEQQHPAAADPVSGGGQPEGDAGVTGQGEGEQQADGALVQPDLDQVERQDDREKAIGKQADDAGGKKDGNVAAGHARKYSRYS